MPPPYRLGWSDDYRKYRLETDQVCTLDSGVSAQIINATKVLNLGIPVTKYDIKRQGAPEDKSYDFKLEFVDGREWHHDVVLDPTNDYIVDVGQLNGVWRVTEIDIIRTFRNVFRDLSAKWVVVRLRMALEGGP